MVDNFEVIVTVESFPLTIGKVFRHYTKLPLDASSIFYHYTTHRGLDGILRSGGLRATYRMEMDDTGEFEYARSVVYETLLDIGRRVDLPNVTQSLVTYIRKNLDQFLQNTSEISSAYCGCLTVSPDHPGQWEKFAENGKGYVIGFNLHQFLTEQIPKVSRQEPYIFSSPVIYNEQDQRELVQGLVEAAIFDLQTFGSTHSNRPEALTALRNRVTKEIVVHLLSLIDFIKAAKFSSERELRLIVEPNNGTLKARTIQFYTLNNESIPFIFIDFRNPNTGRIPLAEIKIGPNAVFSKEKAFVEDLLNKLGYGDNYNDWPQITQSKVA